MANYANAKATIAANVYQNNNNEVTANMVKAGINAVVDTLISGGYLNAGIAHPDDAAVTPDANVFYIASEAGTYVNKGGIIVADGEVAVLKYNGTWSKEITGAATAAQVAELGQQLIKLLPVSVVDNSPNIDGYVILAAGAAAGYLYALATAAYRKIDVEGYKVVHFLGIIQEYGNLGVVGAAFYDSSADPTTSGNTGFIQGIPFEVGTDSVKRLMEYDVPVPDNAKYLYVMSKFGNSDVPTFNDDFYCYLSNESPSVSFDLFNEITNDIVSKIPVLENGSIKRTYDDVAMMKTYVDVITDDWPSGFQVAKDRIRVLVNVKRGSFVIAYMPLGRGCSLQVFNTRKQAIELTIGAIQQDITDKAYAFYVPETEIAKDGILTITLAKNDNSDFTLDEYNSYLAALRFFVIDYGTISIAEKLLGQNKDHLFIGTLVQKSVQSTKLSDLTDNTRVSMLSEVSMPHQDIEIHIKLPAGYQFGIRCGLDRDNLSLKKEWYLDGSNIHIPAGYLYYRCYFRKDNDAIITVDEVRGLVANREIEISYDKDCDIIHSNLESEKYIKSLLRYFFDIAEAGSSDNALRLNGRMPNIPTFAHTSDIHGDVTRYGRFLDYCDYIGVDAALISGDFVANKPSQSCQFINDVADDHNVMVLPCTGNHDCYGLVTSQEQREQIVGYLMEKNDVVTNPLDNYPTYFYKDFVDKKIRIISLNTYEGNRSGHYCNFTQQQCEWFINALSTTPSNYGVLVMFHSPESQPDAESGYDTFYQDKYAYGLYFQIGITGNPISKIIDAFISKVSATVSYRSNSVDITVYPDFTNVNAGVEFIAYVTGHQHIDWIGPVTNTTNRQLMLTVTCTSIHLTEQDPYGGNLSDLPRDDKGSTQDAFNIYGIDRMNKTIRVVRVGSNVNYEGKDRKFMIIHYR